MIEENENPEAKKKTKICFPFSSVVFEVVRVVNDTRRVTDYLC
jgi:hypothetical protein